MTDYEDTTNLKVYLASPYSHEDPLEEKLRYLRAMDAAQWFIERGVWVYSPIVHCHTMAQEYNMPTRAGYWRDYNFALLALFPSFWVLDLDGSHTKSLGVQAELSEARRLGKHIAFVMRIPHGDYEVHHETKEHVDAN